VTVLSATRPPPLHDLLGASFVFNARTLCLAWDRAFAGFGLANGALAMLRAHWQGGPVLQMRPGGGVQIVPGEAPPPPPAIFALHKGALLALAGERTGGFITGGADGAVMRLLDGEASTLETRPRRPIVAVAAGRGGRRAFAAGRSVTRLGPEAGRTVLSAAVTSLAYDPSGLHLAIGYEGGVSLEACSVRHAPRHEVAGAITQLAWDASGTRLAAAGPLAGVVVYDRRTAAWQPVQALRGAPEVVQFTARGDLVIGGAGFVQALRGDVLASLGEALTAPLACHPRLDVIAVSTTTGEILLRHLDVADAMPLREAGAAPRLLDFAPDGEALAFAAADGEAGIADLPGLLFREGAAP